MLHAMVLAIVSLNKVVGSLFHSLVTNGIDHAAQDTNTRMVRLYVRDLIDNLNFLSYHFRMGKITFQKKLTSDCKPLVTSN